MLRDRLRENEVAQANFILVLGALIARRSASEWWEDFAEINREEFEKTAADLVGPEGRFAILRRPMAEKDLPKGAERPA